MNIVIYHQESSRVWVPDKPFAQDLINEAVTFPNATYDDQVDAMTMAIHYMKESWHLSHPEDPDWEDEPRKKKVAYWRV